MSSPTTDLDPFEQMLRARMHRLADLAPTAVPATNDVRITAGEPRRRRRVAGIGATIALIAGGVGLTTLTFQGAGEPGGADSPEAAVREFAAALAAEDLLGMIDVTLPEEVTALRAAFEEVTAEAERIGLLDETFALGGVAGVDVTVDGLVLSTVELDVDLVAVTSSGGRLGAGFDAAAFPLGALIGEGSAVRIDSGRASYDLAAEPVTLVTIRRGDRWYVSTGISVAEAIRRSNGAGPPEAMGLVVEGSDSPESAAVAFYERLARLDLPSALALMAPGEGDVLRRYGSLWVPQAQRALIDAGADGLAIDVSELGFERTADRDGRVTLRPVEYVIAGTVPASWDAQSNSGATWVPEWPTIVDAADGSGAWILEPGVSPPATVAGLGDPLPYESDAVQQAYDGPFNSILALPDGTIVGFDAAVPTPSDPLPFRVERRDGCTTAAGPPFAEIMSYSPGVEHLDDGSVRSCGPNEGPGIASAMFLLLAQGGSLVTLPSVTLVEDDGAWFVSPIGTLAAQLLGTTRSLPDDVNMIDVPLLPYMVGAIGRADLDRALRDATDLPRECRSIVEPDGTGSMRTIADPTLPDVKACAGAMGYSGDGLGTETSVVFTEEAVPAPTVDGVPADTTPATP